MPVGTEHLREALLQLLAREDRRRAELLRRRGNAGGAIDEVLGRLQQHLGGRLSCVESNQLNLAALLGGEFHFHTTSVPAEGAGASIDLW